MMSDYAIIIVVLHDLNGVMICLHDIHTELSAGRRIAIPAELCPQYGIEPGDPVVLEPSESGIVVRPLDAVIRDVQAFFSEHPIEQAAKTLEQLLERQRVNADVRQRNEQQLRDAIGGSDGE